MPVSKIPFPEITVTLKTMAALTGQRGQLNEAIANQEALRQESESNEGEPRIYGVRWVVGDERATSHKVLEEVTVTARVMNIPDGESVTFSIKRPTETTDEEGNIAENEEDVIELTGTVEDKEVSITWEIEKTPEE